MHYYQFNIGDYKSHTGHLSPIEDLIYRRLLDVYYLTERPLNTGLTAVSRQISMREYEEDVRAILEEFFTLTDDGWINKRADQEISKYHSKVEQASKAGKASAERRLNGRSTDVQLNIKQETINIKHKTENNKKEIAIKPDGVDDAVFNDFLRLRKAKRAPLTETALSGIANEATKARITLQTALEICCKRGWQSFDAGWDWKPKNDTSQQAMPTRPRRELPNE